MKLKSQIVGLFSIGAMIHNIIILNQFSVIFLPTSSMMYTVHFSFEHYLYGLECVLYI